MAHMLERLADGTYSIAYAGEVPWHGLGKAVPADLTPAQIQKAAGLDWRVEKVPAFITYKGKKIPTGQCALVRDRDGVILSNNVSDDWEEVQNDEAFEFFHDFVMEGDMEMHTAGSINDGKMVWALAKVKESFTVFGKKDKVESYLLFSNPHQYGKVVDIRFTPIRVVCNNTLTLSLNKKSDLMIRLNHRRKFDAELVKRTLGIATDKMKLYKEAAVFLGGKKYTKKSLTEYLTTLFPTTSKKDEKKNTLSRPAKIAYDIVETQPGADFAPGTWWNAFNAVTFGIDHLFGHNDNSRIANSWYGPNRLKKVKALELATEFAEAA